jgi:hypothetical protein
MPAFRQRTNLTFVGAAPNTVKDNPATDSTDIYLGPASDWLNVKAYGALGDNSANDTAAIQAALAAAAAGDRKTVYFPCGTYIINDTLEPTGRVNMIGAGQAATVILSNANGTIIHPVRDSEFRSCYIEKLTVRGNVATGTANVGILCDDDPYSYGMVIRDVRIENCGGHGLQIGRVFSSVFENIFITNCERDPFYHDAVNMPGNVFRSVYIGDIRANGKCGFRIKAGDFMGYDLNGVNSIQAGSAWMIVGKKNGVDGDTDDGSASVWLQNCNIESSNKYGILLYGSSQLTCVGRTYFALNTGAGSETPRYAIFYDNNGDGVDYFAPLHPRGMLDEGCNFANGLANYANNQAIHANGFAMLEIDGMGPVTGGGFPLNTYYDELTGKVESLPRRGGRLSKRTITSTVEFTYPGVSYLEVDSSGGAFDLTLAWSGWDERCQQPVIIKDVGLSLDTDPVTVKGGAGGKINGDAAGFVMNQNGMSITLVPEASTTGDDWRVVAQWPAALRSRILEDGDYDVNDWNTSGYAIPAVIRGPYVNGTGPNPPFPVLALALDGINGSTFASIVEFQVGRYENAGTSARSELTIAATHGGNEIAATPVVKLRSDKSANFQGEFGGPHTTGSGSGAQNINWDSANQCLFTLTNNVTFTFVGGKAGRTYTLITRQSSGGSHSITWPTIKWPGGATGVITSTANRYDIWTFYFDGTNYFNIAKVQNFT